MGRKNKNKVSTMLVENSDARNEIDSQLREVQHVFNANIKTFNFISRKVYLTWMANKSNPTEHYSACVLQYLYDNRKKGSINTIKKLNKSLLDGTFNFNKPKTKTVNNVVAFKKIEPFNFSVVCKKSYEPYFSEGTVYDVIDGILMDDDNYGFGYYVDIGAINDEFYHEFAIHGMFDLIGG